jgi:hypothetical protein
MGDKTEEEKWEQYSIDLAKHQVDVLKYRRELKQLSTRDETGGSENPTPPLPPKPPGGG